MVRMSATEVARNFSAVVNRVLAGEEIEVIRNGHLSSSCAGRHGHGGCLERRGRISFVIFRRSTRISPAIWKIYVGAAGLP
jgi:hypothetical protein